MTIQDNFHGHPVIGATYHLLPDNPISRRQERWLRYWYALDRYDDRWRFEAVQALAVVSALQTTVGARRSGAGTARVWRTWARDMLAPDGVPTSRGSVGMREHDSRDRALESRDSLMASCVEILGLVGLTRDWEDDLALLQAFQSREGFHDVTPGEPRVGWFNGPLLNDTWQARRRIRQRAVKRGYVAPVDARAE